MQLIIKGIGLSIFLLAIGCALRTTPAPIVHATAVPKDTPAPSTQPQPTVGAPTTASDNPKVTAIEENDNDVQEAQTTVHTESGVGGAKAVAKSWVWPTKGDITEKFTPHVKGIDIPVGISTVCPGLSSIFSLIHARKSSPAEPAVA